MKNAIEFLKAIFLHKRMKAFYWTSGGMFFAALSIVGPEVLNQYNSPETIAIFVGLVLNQVTKALNTKK